MIDTKNFNEDLETFISYSKNVRDKKGAIEAVIHYAYALACSPQLHKFARPFERYGCVNLSSLFEVHTKDEREFELLKKATNSLLKIYADNEPFTDVLTVIYGEHLGYDKGQHMTPPDLANMLASFTLQNLSDNFNGSHSITVGDPTGCGTGAMILASIKHVYKKYGRDGLSYCNFIGVEMDRTLAMATVFQVEMSSIMHDIQFNSFEVWNENALTCNFEYSKLFYGSRANQFAYKPSKNEKLQIAA